MPSGVGDWAETFSAVTAAIAPNAASNISQSHSPAAASTTPASKRVDAGVALPRVLWVRAPGLREAFLATERVLEVAGFGLLLLNATGRESPSAGFVRLARRVAGTHTALVALSLERAAGTAATVALEMEPARAHFTGTPPLLEAVDVVAHLVRHRSAPTGRSARVRLRTS